MHRPDSHHQASQHPSTNASSSKLIRFHKGRGAGSNLIDRFANLERHADRDFLDHLESEGEDQRRLTRVSAHPSRSIISRNQSPDLSFDQSINPYLGCEHGCTYCYARPTHAYLGLSPGLDFETRIFAKHNAAALLRSELSRSSYRPSTLALGANTDPYQPVESKLGITREILQVLEAYRLPVVITTKSAMVVRDADILVRMASRNLVRVYISIGTLDASLAARLEPRANTPARRLHAMKRLTQQGIPVGVFTSPLIPGLNDSEMETILKASQQAGAQFASYVILRLPLEVRDLFVEWLEHHYPLKARRVMTLIRGMRHGKDYDSDFRVRMRGAGAYAALLGQRFRLACRRYGLNTDRTAMTNSQFIRPDKNDNQLNLF